MPITWILQRCYLKNQIRKTALKWRNVWRLWDRASSYISMVKPTRCTIFEFTEYHSTCFGRSFRPSSEVQDCTHSIRYMSYSLADCLLKGMRWNSMEFHPVPASKQSTNLYDIYLMLCVQSCTPDDGRKDRPKHVEWYSVKSKIVHLVVFTIKIAKKSLVTVCHVRWVLQSK